MADGSITLTLDEALSEKLERRAAAAGMTELAHVDESNDDEQNANMNIVPLHNAVRPAIRSAMRMGRPPAAAPRRAPR